MSSFFFWIFDCEVGLTSIGQAKCAVDQNSLYTDLRILGKHFNYITKYSFNLYMIYFLTLMYTYYLHGPGVHIIPSDTITNIDWLLLEAEINHVVKL